MFLRHKHCFCSEITLLDKQLFLSVSLPVQGLFGGDGGKGPYC